MIEIFNYTERIVNMIRPRKLLFMAIGAFSHNRYTNAECLCLRQMEWRHERK